MSCSHFNPYRCLLTLESGRVTRYHSAVTVQPQTLAAHQWGCAMLAVYITGGDISARLLTECLVHDTPELFTGDVPYTAKQEHPSLKLKLDELETHYRTTQLLVGQQELTSKEWEVLKMADTLEGLLWCSHAERGHVVFSRWKNAYHHGAAKWRTLLPSEWMNRADILVATLPTNHHG